MYHYMFFLAVTTYVGLHRDVENFQVASVLNGVQGFQLFFFVLSGFL